VEIGAEERGAVFSEEYGEGGDKEDDKDNVKAGVFGVGHVVKLRIAEVERMNGEALTE
jgi:hypothetical protein